MAPVSGAILRANRTLPSLRRQKTGQSLRTLLLFVATALAEIVGSYLSCLWSRQGKRPLLLITAGGSLTLWDGIGSLLALSVMAIHMAASRAA
jgi:hypothetical protein